MQTNYATPVADYSAINLKFEGDTETIGGVTFTLVSEPDTDSSVLDDEWYGELVEIRDSEQHRPRHFNGRARKIGGGYRCNSYWWQPPSDVKDEYLAEVRSTLERLLEEGFTGYGLKASDAITGESIGEAWLWGCDEVPTGYLPDLAREAVMLAWPITLDGGH